MLAGAKAGEARRQKRIGASGPTRTATECALNALPLPIGVQTRRPHLIGAAKAGTVRSSSVSAPQPLDVTGYARLWRLTWWTQHVELPLATFIAGMLIFLGVTYGLGLLDAFETALNAQISDQLPNESERQGSLTLAATVFNLLRDGFGLQLYWMLAITAAAVFLLIAYGVGCGRFRLRIVSLSLGALAVLTVAGAVGTVCSIELSDLDEGASQTLYAQALFAGSGLVAAVAALLLLVRGTLVLRLWRHRLRPDLPRTHRMTRSLGVNLAMPQFGWPRISATGAAVHAAIALALGIFVYLFPRWTLITAIYGPIDLFFLIFNTPVQIVTILTRYFNDQPLLLEREWATFFRNVDDLAKLILAVAVLMVAGAFWRFGRRLNLRRRNDIILKDKPPVLLLRSFSDDVAGIPSNMLVPRLFRRRKRLEEMIGEELTRAGPFVAIGKPGERLPQIGASRLYLDDSEWQTVVQSYIARSGLIIMIAGKTHWVQWELRNVIAQGRIARLLIVFPRIKETDRAERWLNLRAAFDATGSLASAARVDVGYALAVFATGAGEFTVIKSHKAHESDYEAALRVATYLMPHGEMSATATPQRDASGAGG